MTDSASGPGRRLAAALDAYVRRNAGGHHGSDEEFLAEHAELRDLLEPMLASVAPEAERDPDAAPGGPRDPDEVYYGEFRIIQQIGEGGMGVVYEAWQPSLQRRVALKVLPRQPALRVETVARFESEARLAASLDHPGIVEVYAVGTEGGTHYFAMELIEGEPLDRLLRATRSPAASDSRAQTITAIGAPAAEQPAVAGDAGPASGWSAPRTRAYVHQVVEMVSQVADALAHAHRSGVIHRDIKPSNIIRRPDGRLVLTDFGLAKDLGIPSMTVTGQFAGTPHYVSPEQAMTERVDRRTDIFSLGATLYELLTLELPFIGDTIQDVLARIVHGEPRDPRKANPAISADLAAVLSMALEKDPDRRYQTAEDFAADLRAFLDSRPVRARRLSAPQRLLRWVKREPLKAGLVATLVVAVPGLTGLGGYLFAVRGEIETGAIELRRQEFDRHLARGYEALQSREHAAALGCFDRALAVQESAAEAVAGRALAMVEAGDVQAALADLRSRRDPALARLAAHCAVLLGEPGAEHVATGGEAASRSATDCFLEAVALLSTSQQVVGIGRAERAYQCLLEANLRSPRVRLPYLFQLANAAGLTMDADRLRDSLAVLRSHWPALPEVTRLEARAWTRIQPERGLASADRGLAEDPDNVELQLIRARALARTGRSEEARRFLEAFTARQPLHADAKARLANAYEILGRYDDALRVIGEAIALRPHDRDLRYQQANCLRRSGQSEQAIRVLEELRGDRTPEALWYWMMSFTLIESGSAPRGRAPGSDPVLEYARLAVEAEPGDPRFLGHYGRMLYRRGRDEQALPLLQRALQRDPRDFRANVTVAKVLARKRQLEAARRHAAIAAEVVPTDRDAGSRVSVGYAYWLIGDHAEAETWYRAAVEIDPTWATAQNNLGQALLALQRPAEAVDHLQRAVRDRPGYAEAHTGLAQALLTLKRYDEYVAHAKEWVRDDPQNVRAWTNLADASVASWAPRRDPEAGLRAAREAVRVGADKEPFALFTLARMLCHTRHFEEALAALSRSEKLLAGGTPQERDYIRRNAPKVRSWIERSRRR